MAIYTNRGEGGSVSAYTDINTVRIEGFSPVKEFFSPDYTPGKETDILKDERSTINWNPYLTPEQGNKRIMFSFFNSDSAKN